MGDHAVWLGGYQSDQNSSTFEDIKDIFNIFPRKWYISTTEISSCIQQMFLCGDQLSKARVDWNEKSNTKHNMSCWFRIPATVHALSGLESIWCAGSNRRTTSIILMKVAYTFGFCSMHERYCDFYVVVISSVYFNEIHIIWVVCAVFLTTSWNAFKLALSSWSKLSISLSNSLSLMLKSHSRARLHRTVGIGRHWWSHQKMWYSMFCALWCK